MKYHLNLSRLIFLLAILSFFAAPWGMPSTYAQTSGEEGPYFYETGHRVSDAFYDYFVNHGGVGRFGYPITEAFVDTKSGLWVQYFQNVRIELHPENSEPYNILLGLLGEELGKRQAPIPVNQIPAANDPICYYFAETGHKLCHSFLDYYRANGSIDMFGYPITEYLYENGYIVQYFQRARFEWRPSRPAGQRVIVAALGEIYFDYAKLPKSLLAPVPDINALQPPKASAIVTGIFARSSVLNAITRQGGSQTGYVYVYDQLNQPISGASVTLVVKYPAPGKSETFVLPPTNSQGITFRSFPVGLVKPGQMVVMEFYITYNNTTITSRTSYMMWYY